MPIYTVTFTIPANTPSTNPTTSEVEIEGYVLEKISILIPSGHQALAHMRVKYGIKNIVPFEEEQWLEGDNESITFEPWWILPETPCRIVLEGYNEDDTYSHSFYVRFTTKWKHEILPQLIVKSFLQGLRRLFGWV